MATNMNTLILDDRNAAAVKTLSDYDRKVAMLDLLILQAAQSSSVEESKARAEVTLGRKL